MSRLADMDLKEFSKLKKEALRYLYRKGHLYRRAKAFAPLRRVINDLEKQQEIVSSLYDEASHRGREATSRKVSDRYY
jgi:hypothetical protein